MPQKPSALGALKARPYTPRPVTPPADIWDVDQLLAETKDFAGALPSDPTATAQAQADIAGSEAWRAAHPNVRPWQANVGVTGALLDSAATPIRVASGFGGPIIGGAGEGIAQGLEALAMLDGKPVRGGTEGSLAGDIGSTLGKVGTAAAFGQIGGMVAPWAAGTSRLSSLASRLGVGIVGGGAEGAVSNVVQGGLYRGFDQGFNAQPGGAFDPDAAMTDAGLGAIIGAGTGGALTALSARGAQQAARGSTLAGDLATSRAARLAQEAANPAPWAEDAAEGFRVTPWSADDLHIYETTRRGPVARAREQRQLRDMPPTSGGAAQTRGPHIPGQQDVGDLLAEVRGQAPAPEAPSSVDDILAELDAQAAEEHFAAMREAETPRTAPELPAGRYPAGSPVAEAAQPFTPPQAAQPGDLDAAMRAVGADTTPSQVPQPAPPNPDELLAALEAEGRATAPELPAGRYAQGSPVAESAAPFVPPQAPPPDPARLDPFFDAMREAGTNPEAPRAPHETTPGPVAVQPFDMPAPKGAQPNDLFGAPVHAKYDGTRVKVWYRNRPDPVDMDLAQFQAFHPDMAASAPSAAGPGTPTFRGPAGADDPAMAANLEALRAERSSARAADRIEADYGNEDLETILGTNEPPAVEAAEPDVEAMLRQADEQDAAAAPAEPSVEVLDPEAERIRNNASGDSSASVEAMNRQRSMASRGESFVMLDRAGRETPLIGTDAVDQVPAKGQTKAIRKADGSYEIVQDNGGKVPPRRPPPPEAAPAAVAPKPPEPAAPAAAAAEAPRSELDDIVLEPGPPAPREPLFEEPAPAAAKPEVEAPRINAAEPPAKVALPEAEGVELGDGDTPGTINQAGKFTPLGDDWRSWTPERNKNLVIRKADGTYQVVKNNGGKTPKKWDAEKAAIREEAAQAKSAAKAERERLAKEKLAAKPPAPAAAPAPEPTAPRQAAPAARPAAPPAPEPSAAPETPGEAPSASQGPREPPPHRIARDKFGDEDALDVHFETRPDQDILDALRAYGFRYVPQKRKWSFKIPSGIANTLTLDELEAAAGRILRGEPVESAQTSIQRQSGSQKAAGAQAARGEWVPPEGTTSMLDRDLSLDQEERKARRQRLIDLGWTPGKTDANRRIWHAPGMRQGKPRAPEVPPANPPRAEAPSAPSASAAETDDWTAKYRAERPERLASGRDRIIDRAAVDRAAEAYSGDTLDKSRVRKVFEHDGEHYVAFGIGHELNGGKSVIMRRVYTPEEFAAKYPDVTPWKRNNAKSDIGQIAQDGQKRTWILGGREGDSVTFHDADAWEHQGLTAQERSQWERDNGFDDSSWADDADQPEAPTPPERAALDAAGTTPAERDARQVPADQIKVDADAYQFKTGGDERGRLEKLKGVDEWDPLAGKLTRVLLHERTDGSLYVVDGHQRVGLAQDLIARGKDVPPLNAIVLREADGVTVEDARRAGAFFNVLGGTTEPVDIARVLRSGDLSPSEQRRVGRIQAESGERFRQGRDLAALEPAAFNQFLQTTIEPRYARLVSQYQGEKLQQALITALEQGDPSNVSAAKSILAKAADAQITESQPDIFGNVTLNTNAAELVKFEQQVLGLFKKNRRLFGKGATNAEFLERAGETRIDREAMNAISTEAGKAEFLFDKFVNASGSHTKQAIKETFDEVKAGKLSLGAASDRVAKALEADFTGRAPSSGEGPGPVGEGPRADEGPGLFGDEGEAGQAGGLFDAGAIAEGRASGTIEDAADDVLDAVKRFLKDEKGELNLEGLGEGLQGLEAAFKRNPKLVWRAVRAAGGALVGASLHDDDEDATILDNLILGAAAGVASTRVLPIARALARKAPTFAKALREAVNDGKLIANGEYHRVPQVRKAPDLTKDISGFQKYAWSPDKVVPDVWKHVEPIMRDLYDIEAAEGTPPALRKVARIQKVQEAVAYMKGEIKAAKDVGHYRRAEYIDELMKELKNKPTWIEKRVEELTDGKVSPKRVRQANAIVTNAVYHNLLGWAVDSGLQNMSQALLNIPQIGVKSTVKGIIRAYSKEGRQELKFLNLARRPMGQDEERLFHPWLEKYLDLSQTPMRFSDSANRRATYAGAMDYAAKRGMSESAAKDFAMSLVGQTQGIAGDLGNNPFHRHFGPLRVFTKYPLVWASMVEDIARHPDPRVKMRALGLMTGVYAASAISGIEWANFFYPRVGGLPGPSAAYDVLSHSFGTAEHDFEEHFEPGGTEDVLLPRYWNKGAQILERMDTHGDEPRDVIGRKGQVLRNVTAEEDLASLFGIETKERSDTRQQESEMYDFAEEAKRDEALRSRRARRAAGLALEQGDEEGARTALEALSQRQRRAFLKDRTMTPRERARRQTPLRRRGEFDEQFEQP